MFALLHDLKKRLQSSRMFHSLTNSSIWLIESHQIGEGIQVRYLKQGLLVVFCLFGLILYGMISKPLLETMRVSADQELRGRTIVIDPGHGGRDNGAQVDGVKEDILNLQVSMELKKLVEQAGGTIILTRDDDYDLSSEAAKNHKKEDLEKRVQLMNQEEVDLFISIHMNKFGQAKVKGAQVFYQVNHPLSKMLAQSIQDTFQKQLSSKKLPRLGNYYILNETTTTGVLVECGFMSNPEELLMLQDTSYQTKVAYAIYKGIVEYLKQQFILI